MLTLSSLRFGSGVLQKVAKVLVLDIANFLFTSKFEQAVKSSASPNFIQVVN